jgi:hypothetical protein
LKTVLILLCTSGRFGAIATVGVSGNADVGVDWYTGGGASANGFGPELLQALSNASSETVSNAVAVCLINFNQPLDGIGGK